VRKPESSVLDYLGPWPWYIAAQVAIISTLWALMTWPWVRGSADRPRQGASR